MKSPTTITEAIEQLEKNAKSIFECLYPARQRPKICRGGDLGEDEKTDSDLHLEIDEWIFITPIHTKEKYPCIGGERERDAIHYTIQRVEFIRGCHGGGPDSWTPDETDIVEVKLDKPITGPFQAISFACKMMLENELDMIGENMSEQEMVDEEEKWGEP